ncbi:interleukin-5 receptor subunit alpha-like [Anableps anableps]
MKLSPALPVLWCGFLLLRFSQGEYEGHVSDVCTFSSVDNEEGPSECQQIPEDTEAVVCVVYKTNMLNCSWSFPTLEKDAQLSVSVSFLKNENLVDSRMQSSAKRVGFMSWIIDNGEDKLVVVSFNVTLHDAKICCTASFEEDLLNVLPPPANVSALIQDDYLNVRWDVPSKMFLPHCFGYQMDMGDQEKLRNFTKTLHYMEPNAAHTYRVRMRTRILSVCYGCTQWSEWSPTVTVEQPPYRLNPLVIAVISLGIPMILLAVLLMLRHQRLVKVLFPPIPHPPAKYKHFLEKTDPLSFFHPVPATKPEEEITEVEDAEQNPGTAN